jgi:hypothetical protein
MSENPFEQLEFTKNLKVVVTNVGQYINFHQQQAGLRKLNFCTSICYVMKRKLNNLNTSLKINKITEFSLNSYLV